MSSQQWFRRRILGAAIVVTLVLATGETSAGWRRMRSCPPAPCGPIIWYPPLPCILICPNVPPCPPNPFPPDPPPSTQKIRRNINSLTPAQLESLKRGVAAMKALPDADPRSWRFQANIHGTDDPATSPLFNQCKHGTLEFLIWHRGYVYYFERILRELSGDPELTLPYWDWREQRSLPAVFRTPADMTNPLYDGTRKPSINTGTPVPDNLVVNDLDAALAHVPFPPSLPNLGFSPSFERSPHGSVHVEVGGNMRLFETAGRDPIFWLHHCNIDRVWDLWLNQGGGRMNPSDPALLDTAYAFADETGRTVTLKARDILTSAQLGYRYDNVPNPARAAAVVAFAAQAPELRSFARVASTAKDDQPAAGKPLGLKPVTEKLAVAPKHQAVFKALGTGDTARPGKLLLQIEGLSASDVPEYSYAVYLNLPEGDVTPEQARRHYVGSFNFFGKARGAQRPHGHDDAKGFTETFDVTALVAGLQKAGQWKQDDLRVTLRPLTMAEGADRKRLEASAERAKVTYTRVSLLAAP